jgi:hypothetical protein
MLCACIFLDGIRVMLGCFCSYLAQQGYGVHYKLLLEKKKIVGNGDVTLWGAQKKVSRVQKTFTFRKSYYGFFPMNPRDPILWQDNFTT